MHLSKLIEEFDKMDLPQSIQLDKGSKVHDVKEMVKTHVDVLQAHSGRVGYMPYYNRLLKLYKLCQQQ